MRVCADIGGSFATVALVTEHGRISRSRRRATPADDWSSLVAFLAEALEESAAEIAPDAPLCIALAGFLDPRDERAFCANVPCLHGRTVGKDLPATLGRPVLIVNDADAFALAEARLGAGRGHERVFGVILGTGVGGGLVEGGALASGFGGVAGEWGHGPVVTRSRTDPAATPYFPCGCGRSGCLNTVGGARGLERLHDFIHGETSTSREITARWAAKEAAAAATVDLWLELVAGPLAMLTNACAIDAVPVGGGLAGAEGLVAALDAAVRARMLKARPDPLLVPAVLGPDAGLIGAALAADA